jgi:hypothetical protein
MEIMVAHMCPAFINIAVQAATANASISTGFLICLLPWLHRPLSLHPAQHRHHCHITAHPQVYSPFIFQPIPLLVPCHNSLLAEDVERFSRWMVKVTSQHNEECRKLLALMGIPVMIVSCVLPALKLIQEHSSLGEVVEHLCAK